MAGIAAPPSSADFAKFIDFVYLLADPDRLKESVSRFDKSRTDYNQARKALENTTMSDQDFNTQLMRLQSGTMMQWNKLQHQRRQKAAEVEQVQGLIRSGTQGMGPEQEAATRMNLGPEAERLAFPKQKFLSPSYLRSKGFRENLLGYANAAPDQRGLEWGPPKKKREDLIAQYQRWQESELYHQEKSPQEQKQLDQEWDASMRSSRAYTNWFADKGLRVLPTAVTALRSKGRIANAMRGKVVTRSPIGSGMRTQLDREKPTEKAPAGSPYTPAPQSQVIRQRNKVTGETRISYDGGQTWQ